MSDAGPKFVGGLYERQLPDERWVVVYPMTFGKARLCVGDEWTVEDGWCYADPRLAIVAAAVWDGEGDPMDGWHRQISTGRRRTDGDPAREYVNP